MTLQKTTGWRGSALAWAIAIVSTTVAPVGAVESWQEVHGSADAFAMPGLALAWAVLREVQEADTAVVIRIDPDPATFAAIEVVGKDPFTQHEERLQPRVSVGGAFDLKVPRARFADHPRTEIRLWKSAPADRAPPSVVVYYLGVPDTTPEVLRSGDLDRSLSVRIERARRESTRSSP